MTGTPAAASTDADRARLDDYRSLYVRLLRLRSLQPTWTVEDVTAYLATATDLGRMTDMLAQRQTTLELLWDRVVRLAERSRRGLNHGV